MRSLILTTLFISTALISGPLNLYKSMSDSLFGHLFGYQPISDLTYPQAKNYFSQLCIQYPKELQNINFAIGEFKWFMPPLLYSYKTIYIPEKWIQKLQMQDQYYQDLVEWHVLRQSGFMNSNQYLRIPATMITAALLSKYAGERTLHINENGSYRLKSLSTTQEIAEKISAVLPLYVLYQFFAREYIADAYACQICTNPRALQAGYNYISRTQSCGLISAIFQSCASLRMENIQKAYIRKFGKIMPILVADQELL